MFMNPGIRAAVRALTLALSQFWEREFAIRHLPQAGIYTASLRILLLPELGEEAR